MDIPKTLFATLVKQGRMEMHLTQEALAENSEYRRLILETSNAIKAVPVWNYFVKPCRL